MGVKELGLQCHKNFKFLFIPSLLKNHRDTDTASGFHGITGGQVLKPGDQVV